MRYEPQEPFAWRDIARVFALFAAFAALMMAVPCLAAVYGPPVPVEDAAPLPDGYRLVDAETMAQIEARIQRDTRGAWTRFWIGQGLAGADLALTCFALSQRNPDGTPKFREANPVFGRNANCGTIAAIKVGVGVIQYFLARKAISDDPTRAKKTMNWTIAINGAVVGWNAGQLAK